MNRVHIRDLGRADDTVNAEVTLVGGGFADADGFIRELNVHRVGVHLGIDRHRANVQLFARADDTNGDLTAIG